MLAKIYKLFYLFEPFNHGLIDILQKFKMEMAINNKDNMINVATLQSPIGKSSYHCPICDQQVRYIKGSKNRKAVFRHKSNAACHLTLKGDFSETSLMGC